MNKTKFTTKEELKFLLPLLITPIVPLFGYLLGMYMAFCMNNYGFILGFIFVVFPITLFGAAFCLYVYRKISSKEDY